MAGGLGWRSVTNLKPCRNSGFGSPTMPLIERMNGQSLTRTMATLLLNRLSIPYSSLRVLRHAEYHYVFATTLLSMLFPVMPSSSTHFSHAWLILGRNKEAQLVSSLQRKLSAAPQPANRGSDVPFWTLNGSNGSKTWPARLVVWCELQCIMQMLLISYQTRPIETRLSAHVFGFGSIARGCVIM